eukprot:Em0010g390a
MYQLIRSLLAPIKLTDKTLDELFALVKDHLEPAPSAIMQRFNFNARSQKSDESVAEFVAELRHIVEHCEYGGTLDEMLCDRLVCGIRAEPKLTFVKALEISQAAELAEKGARVLQPQQGLPAESVNAIVDTSQGSCYRCGRKHSSDDCKCKDWICRVCGKKDHVAGVCRQVESRRNREWDKVHPPLTVTVEVNKAKLCMEVDTGAADSILSESTFQRLWPEGARPLLRQSAVMLRTYSGEKLSIRGRDWLAALNIPLQELLVMQTVSDTNLQSILNSHKELFKDELGLLRGVKTKLYVHDSCKPCFFKPRTVPYAIREKVEVELDRLEKAGVIEKAGLRLKLTKCSFMLPSVEYLGHIISSEGIRPTEEKTRAIVEAPMPLNVSQLRSFLGLLNYYGKFLPHLSSVLAPLYVLLKKNSSWCWGKEQQEAIKKSKELLISATVLIHFDPKKKLVLACDASPPIAFASRSLAPAEKKYSQLEKEGLVVVFDVIKFQQYLQGRDFTILSDHNPPQYLLSADRAITHGIITHSTMGTDTQRILLPNCIQSWQTTGPSQSQQQGNSSLSSERKKKSAIWAFYSGNVDTLSRLPLNEAPDDVPLPGDTVYMLEALDSSCPVTTAAIKSGTDKDPILSCVRNFVLHGNWDAAPKEPKFVPYRQREHELSVQNDCLLWGSRVVVLKSGREAVLTMLHDAHPGVTRMKVLARGIVWWPGIDSDLEAKVKACHGCAVICAQI